MEMTRPKRATTRDDSPTSACSRRPPAAADPGVICYAKREAEAAMKRQPTESLRLLIGGFKSFLASYDRDCPFKRHGQLQYHVETIRLRRQLGSARAALADPAFQRSLYKTLQAWGIGSRASALRPLPEFVAALKAKASTVEELDGLAIDHPSLDVDTVGASLARLAQSLDIVSNKARIVPGSKALHHILPEMVVPIDREYTQRFFEWANPTFQNSPERCFREAFTAFVTIARETNAARYVGDGWYTSRTKVIDNAIVGLWCWIKAKVRANTR
jgi:hypothetical protein